MERTGRPGGTREEDSRKITYEESITSDCDNRSDRGQAEKAVKAGRLDLGLGKRHEERGGGKVAKRGNRANVSGNKATRNQICIYSAQMRVDRAEKTRR